MADDVAASFPQVDLTPLTTITVTLDDPAATITQLAVHGYQTDIDETPPFVQPGTAFAFGDDVA